MNIRQTLSLATNKLRNKSTSPALDAEVLLSFLLKKDKAYLYTNSGKKILNTDLNKYSNLVKKRSRGWPVAYLTGHKEFYGLDFLVTPDVLIPRPETEGLVDLVLEKIEDQSGLKILDVGTGSGCIIISLAHSLTPHPSSLFFASDISPKALAVAKRNARKHKVKIKFKQSNLLSNWKNQHFDIIVANLPYLPKQTDPSTKFEPKQALVAKKQGLELIERLFKQLSVIPAKAGIQTTGSRIKSGMTKWPQYIFLEIGHNQGQQIKKLAQKFLPAYETKIIKDLSKKDRYAVLSL